MKAPGELDFESGGEYGGYYFPALKPVKKAITQRGEVVHSRFYEYEPGNMTRYSVLFNTYRNYWGAETVMTVVNMRKSMVIAGPMHVASQIGYMKEKLEIGEGDCYALMPLINEYLRELGQ